MRTAINGLLILFTILIGCILFVGIVFLLMQAVCWLEDAPERRAERRRLALSKAETKEMGRTIEHLQNELIVRESRIRELESELELANKYLAMSGRKEGVACRTGS